MSTVSTRSPATSPDTSTVVPERAERRAAEPEPGRRGWSLPSARWLVGCVLGWLVVTVLCAAIVVYAVGPLLQARHQRVLLAELSTSVDESAGGVSDSLFGVAAPTTPPELGAPVALLEIGSLGSQLVVSEGADSSTTQGGPGHVPGTAGPGQPGNSVVVARRAGFGGAFGDLSLLRLGDQIVVTTTQGKSLYTVSARTTGPIDRDAVYGASADNRLTLLTSSTTNVLNTATATAVVATMDTDPFVPSPQGGRTDAQDGTRADTGQWPLLVLLGLGFALAAAGSSVLYRRWSPLATYAVTTPVLVSLVVFTSIVAARLLPGWV